MIQEDSLVLKCKKVKWEGKMTKEKYKDKQKKISTVLNHEQLEIHTIALDKHNQYHRYLPFNF